MGLHLRKQERTADDSERPNVDNLTVHEGHR
jgi:hypothetical protein